MSILLEAQREVDTKVNEQHDDIIREFLDRIEVQPCSCGFQDRMGEFIRELGLYTNLKKEIHRYYRHRNVYDMFSDHIPPAFSFIGAVRKHLSVLAPCPACVIRYNPTNRRKQTPWNPMRARVWKEILR